MDDSDFAARMRARRGELPVLPPAPVDPWPDANRAFEKVLCAIAPMDYAAFEDMLREMWKFWQVAAKRPPDYLRVDLKEQRPPTFIDVGWNMNDKGTLRVEARILFEGGLRCVVRSTGNARGNALVGNKRSARDFAHHLAKEANVMK